MQVEPLLTDRLKIIPLTARQLAIYLDQTGDFESQVGPASRGILTDTLRRAIGMKLERMAESPEEDLPWLTYWLIVVASEEFGAGMIGFKGAPDEEGQVEIGYGIDEDYQNKGYMTEAVVGMIRWAFSDPRCVRILAPDTMRSNIASNRVLQKVGMRIYEEKPDSLSWCLERDWGVI